MSGMPNHYCVVFETIWSFWNPKIRDEKVHRDEIRNSSTLSACASTSPSVTVPVAPPSKTSPASSRRMYLLRESRGSAAAVRAWRERGQESAYHFTSQSSTAAIDAHDYHINFSCGFERLRHRHFEAGPDRVPHFSRGSIQRRAAYASACDKRRRKFQAVGLVCRSTRTWLDPLTTSKATP